MNYIEPITITDALILSGTNVAEPFTGETAWVSGGTYAIGDKRIRTTTHKVYRAITAHTGVTTLPENDPTNWQEYAPTQRWCPFDEYSAATVTTRTDANIVYALQARYANSIYLSGLIGKTVTVRVNDVAGGAEIYNRATNLKRDSTSYYDYYFGQRKKITKLLLTDLPIRAAAEVVVTVGADSAQTRALGLCVIGKKRNFKMNGIGGAEWGFTATPKTLSTISSSFDGKVTITPRYSYIELRGNTSFETRYADFAVQQLTDLLSRPVVWFATEKAGFDGLQTFGLATANMSYTPAMTRAEIEVKGFM